MKIILKHILRNLKEHKMRAFLIFFSLLVSTSVFVISLTISDDLTIKVEDTLRSVYGNAEVQVATVDPFKLDDLKMNKDKYSFLGMSSLDGVDAKEKPISILGMDIEKAVDFKLLGNDAKKLALNEIYINKNLEDKGYKKGQVIKLKYEDKEYNLTIKGVIDNKGIASIRPDDDTFFASIETVNSIKNIEDGYYDTIYFDLDNNNKIGEFVDYIKDHNDNYMVAKTVDMESIKEATSMISTIMYLILLMATIMIYFVISSLNKIILAERIPVIGTFRSVGASRTKMNLILVLENALYGIFAGLFGAIIGTYLDSYCSSVFITADGIDVAKSSVSLSVGTILIGILFATLLQIIIVVKEIIRTNKKPIKDLIFNTQNSRYKMRKKRTVIGFILLISSIILFVLIKNIDMLTIGVLLICFIVGVANTLPLIFQLISKCLAYIFKKIGWSTGIITSKNIGYNKMIISSSRLVVIAISLLSSIILMSKATADCFTSFREVTKNVDLMISNPHKSSEEYDYLNDIDGVKEVQFLNSYFADDITYTKGKNKNKKFNLPPGFYAEKERKNVYIEEIDYKISDLKDGEILFDEKYAFKNNIKKGDKITMHFGTLKKSYTYTVKGFVNASNFNVSRNMVVVSYNHLINDLNGIPLQLHIVLEKGYDADKMKDVVHDAMKEVGIYVQTTEEYISEQEGQVAGIIAIVYLVIGISVTLAFIGILNNQVIGFINRRKEIAILNSTCMNKTQIKKMLALETILSNFISLFIATIVSFITTIFVNNFMMNIGLYLNIKYDFMTVFNFELIVYILLLLTLFVPFRKLKKMNIVDEIKYE